MMSLRKFAEIAGVSPSTISRVFADKPGISEETRQRIFLLARQFDFRPSAVGSIQFGGKTKSIAVVLPSVTVSYFADIACGIQHTLMQKKYLPILLNYNVSSFSDCLKRSIDHRVDGAILYIVNERLKREDFVDLLKLKIPITVIGSTLAGLNKDADIVDTDDFEGGRLAGEYLCKAGHKRIAFAHYGEGTSNCEIRLNGFRLALEQYNVKYYPEYMVNLNPFDSDREEKFCADLEKILLSKNPPTAFFATTDNIAELVYSAAHKLFVKIPEQLSVIGFADLNFAKHINPPLTTIRQDGFAVGEKAAEFIMSRLDNPYAPPRKFIIPVTLVERNSVKKTQE